MKVNYDGGNFVAYGSDDPLDALRALSADGGRAHQTGVPGAAGLVGPAWRLGEGTARVDETIQFLVDAGWAKPLILETYAVSATIR